MLLYLTKFKTSALLLLFCFNIGNLFSQNKSTEPSVNLNPSQERNILEDRSQWKEVEAERKIFSSTYVTPDGRIITEYCKQPINYYNSSGTLVPINIIPVSSSKGLSAINQPNEVSVLKNGSVEINVATNSKIVFSEKCKINGIEISNSELKQDGANAIMSTSHTGVTKTFEFRFNSLKYNYVLNSPIPSTASDFIIEEEIYTTEDSKIIPDDNYGRQDERGWLGPIKIISATGKELGTMRGAVCYDANKNYITAAYKYEKVNGKQKIKIIVPNTWMNDPTRVYPITIDPLVTG